MRLNNNCEGNIMRVLVAGASGCVGQAVVRALRSRGHRVIQAGRRATDGENSLHLDYNQSVPPARWAERLRERQINAVVNCVGILMPSTEQTFERVHTEGPIELFRGAAAAGVTRVVQISALGVGGDAQSLATPYLHSKLLADEALATLALDWAVLRPSLIYGPASQSASLFATLSSLPVIGLPGRGQQAVQPIHVYEVAEAVVRLIEQQGALADVYELGGASAMSYRDMLQHYRDSMGLGPALWLPTPMALMRTLAWASEALPQKVFCRDTINLLARGKVPTPNSAIALLGRSPSSLSQGLSVTPPQPLLDLQVHISPALSLWLRSSLAFMWIYTALISLWWPQESGVLTLLALCGFSGSSGTAAMLLSCALSTVLGVWTLKRPGPLVYALQFGAVLGYTATAAYFMPALTMDHCGGLVKNVPVLALILLLWMARPVGEKTARHHASANALSKPGSVWG
jgi:nucleoside-diphosphate-sugar epimerase